MYITLVRLALVLWDCASPYTEQLSNAFFICGCLPPPAGKRLNDNNNNNNLQCKLLMPTLTSTSCCIVVVCECQTSRIYLCCSTEGFNLCGEGNLAATCCWSYSRLLLCVLTCWQWSSQLSIITSAPCEQFSTLWKGLPCSAMEAMLL